MTERSKIKRLPEWLKVGSGFSPKVHSMKTLLRGKGLATVCESARCPNIGHCFDRPTATFMILGDVCTRACSFCAVRKGEPIPVDPDEPGRLADAATELGLKHVVITSVTRDDLPDGGASHFVRAIWAIKRRDHNVTVEILTPDFKGNASAIEVVCEAPYDVFNHNVETVPRLYASVRPQADYRRSLNLLAMVKRIRPHQPIKSGLMVGLGETFDEVVSLMGDLAGLGCDILTIGQYMRPGMGNVEVTEYLEPSIFDEFRRVGLSLGIREVYSGPLVRSSYHADGILEAVRPKSR